MPKGIGYGKSAKKGKKKKSTKKKGKFDFKEFIAKKNAKKKKK